MSTVIKDLGAVSAYAYAVEKGYTGTEEEYAELMAAYADVGQTAVDAAESALNSNTAAQTAANTATNKASEATTAAQTATTKAEEASTSASTATSAKDTAVSASQTATSKATEATTAAASANTAKNDAETAKNAAETAQGKAEDAQAAAEAVAESIPSDYSQLSADVSDIKGNLNVALDVTGAQRNISSQFSFSANRGVRWDDGTLSVAENRSYSGYVNVEDFDTLAISMIKTVSSTTYGIAFYSAESVESYISGIATNTGADSAPVAETRNISIPSGAKYCRTTWFDTDTTQYPLYTFSCIGIKKGEFEDVQSDVSVVKTDIAELLPMKGAVTDPYPNIIDFGQHDLSIDGVTININGDTLTINGATGSSAIRLKLTGTIEYNRSSSNPSAWNSETVDFIEIGKTYNTYAQKISGTVTGTGDVFSFRNGSGTTVLSESKGSVTVAERIAYGMFYFKYKQTFDHAVYKIVLTETDEKIPVDEVGVKVLNPQITVPYADIAVSMALGEIPKEYTGTLYFTESTYASTHEMQGVATDGDYLYYCMHGPTNSDNSVIGKIDLSTDTLVNEVSNYCYKHTNGMCYYPTDDELRIAPLANSGVIFKVDADTLAYKDSYDIGAVIGTAWTNLTGETLSVAGIAYDPVRDWFVYLLSKTSGLYHGLAICTSDNQLIKIIKCITDYTALRGGITCDEKFIYLCLGDIDGDWGQALLRMYDYNGNVINDVTVESFNTRKHTLEGFCFGDRIFASFANNTIREMTLAKTGTINLLSVLSHFNPN